MKKNYKYQMDEEGMERFVICSASKYDREIDIFRKVREWVEKCNSKDIEVNSKKAIEMMQETIKAYRLRDLFVRCLNCFYFDHKEISSKEKKIYCKQGHWESDSFDKSFKYRDLTPKLIGISLACEDHELYEDYEKFREDVKMPENKYIFYVEDIPTLNYGSLYVFITKKESWENSKNIEDDDFPKGTHQEMYRKGISCFYDGVYEIDNQYLAEGYICDFKQSAKSKKIKNPFTEKQQVIDFMESLGFEYNEEFGKYSLDCHKQDILDRDSESWE